MKEETLNYTVYALAQITTDSTISLCRALISDHLRAALKEITLHHK